MRTVSVDLGGTRCRAAIVDDDGSIVDVIRRDTPRCDAEPHFLVEMVDELKARVGSGPALDGVVVGLPGIVDHRRERLVSAPNLPRSWMGCMNEDWMSGLMGLPVSLANDADLAAVGEAFFGAGRGMGDVVYVTISTGVGAGVVIGGRIVQGVHSGAEIGHVVIDRRAAVAGEYCTVEDLGSGTAIARMAADAGYAERGGAFAELVRRGDDGARSIWTDAIEAAGLGVAAMAWMIVPAIIVIGGGVGCNHDLVLPIIERQLKEFGPNAEDPIRLATAGLCDDAGLVGGAGWWSAVGRQPLVESA